MGHEGPVPSLLGCRCQVLLGNVAAVAAERLLEECMGAVEITFVEREDRPVDPASIDALWQPEPEPARAPCYRPELSWLGRCARHFTKLVHSLHSRRVWGSTLGRVARCRRVPAPQTLSDSHC